MSHDPDAARTERIRTRAFYLWEQDGRPLGRQHEHWNAAALQIAREDGQRQGEAGSDGGHGDHDPAQPLLSTPRRDGAGVDASRTGRTASGEG
ncbi:DUF2934 domain-containing protein [Zavarzinia sp. CC-PAN008]|uniref:DUF2934 domain-containing protein n=1 Tax=Zavarzinia sp. CC-PAN008 TaxID=3243332 RepID=UPI003F745EF2